MMRKYLLLATVATCMMSTNVMAGSIADGGQSAEMTVFATLVTGAEITEVQDMNFGPIVIPSDMQANDKIASLDTDGNLTFDKGLGVGNVSGASASAGSITVEGGSANFSVTCGTDADDGGCRLGGVSGQELSVHIYPTCGTTGSDPIKFGGDLHFVSAGTSGNSIDASGTINITLSY